MWGSNKKTSLSSEQLSSISPPTSLGTVPTSAAFSRLSRPGSGRYNADLESPSSSSAARSGRSSAGSSTRSTSPSPMAESTSPRGLVQEHRISRNAPAGILPSPGGGLIPEQNKKTKGLTISISQPNMKKTSLSLFPGGLPIAPVQPQPSSEERSKLLMSKGAHSNGKLKLGELGEFDFKAEDLTDEGEIGRGAFGTVNRMVFSRGGVRKVMAVKRIRSTVDEREQKELLMDLDVVMRSNDCPCIVMFFGAIFKEGDCWICMEQMATSTDKFYKFIYEQLQECIPENVIGKMTLGTLKALNYLKEKLKIMHRDVKPSNILLDRQGNIKLCDFGISGQLVDSIAKTRDAGCRPYMAPERIDPQRAKGYDVRSDVWSLGITLIELATGCFPYPKWNSVFEQLQQVVYGDPPRLEPRSESGKRFTPDFIDFVNTCLIKDESQRPKYNRLLEHPFVKTSEGARVDVADYVTCVLEQWEASGCGPDMFTHDVEMNSVN